jgi:hypothetical protein
MNEKSQAPSGSSWPGNLESYPGVEVGSYKRFTFEKMRTHADQKTLFPIP